VHLNRFRKRRWVSFRLPARIILGSLLLRLQKGEMPSAVFAHFVLELLPSTIEVPG